MLSVSETGFVSDSSDLPVVGSIEIDVESFKKSWCCLWLCPRILLSSHHAFGFDGVYLSRNRRPPPSLRLRSGHANVLCVLGLVCFPVFGGCSLVLMETSGSVLGRVQGYLGWASFRFGMS